MQKEHETNPAYFLTPAHSWLIAISCSAKSQKLLDAAPPTPDLCVEMCVFRRDAEACLYSLRGHFLGNMKKLNFNWWLGW